MAPAGSYEILEKAIDAGADAIYLGLGAFNARINADNFTLLQLKMVVTMHTEEVLRFILRSILL